MTPPPKPSPRMDPADPQPRQFSAHDLLVIVGLICLATGLWWIYPPAALITIGALFLVAGILGFIRKERTNEQPAP